MNYNLTLVILRRTPKGDLEVLLGMKKGANKLSLPELAIPTFVSTTEFARTAPQKVGALMGCEHQMIGVYDNPEIRTRGQENQLAIAYLYFKTPVEETFSYPGYSFFNWTGLRQALENQLDLDHNQILKGSLETAKTWCGENRLNGHTLIGQKFKLTDLFKLRKKLGAPEKSVANYLRDTLRLGRLKALKKVRGEAGGRPGTLYSLKT